MKKNNEIVFINEDTKPKIIYTPYIYAVIRDFSCFYTVVDNDKKIKVINKE